MKKILKEMQDEINTLEEVIQDPGCSFEIMTNCILKQYGIQKYLDKLKKLNNMK